MRIKRAQTKREKWYAHRATQQDNNMPTINKAINGPDAEEWLKAIQLELETMIKLGVAELVPQCLSPNTESQKTCQRANCKTKSAHGCSRFFFNSLALTMTKHLHRSVN